MPLHLSVEYSSIAVRLGRCCTVGWVWFTCWVWQLSVPLEGDAFGKALLDAGIPEKWIKDGCVDPQVRDMLHAAQRRFG